MHNNDFKTSFTGEVAQNAQYLERKRGLKNHYYYRRIKKTVYRLSDSTISDDTEGH